MKSEKVYLVWYSGSLQGVCNDQEIAKRMRQHIIDGEEIDADDADEFVEIKEESINMPLSDDSPENWAGTEFFRPK